MKSLCGNLVNRVYDSSIGDDLYWKSKFTGVIKYISYFNADDIVSDYFQIIMLRIKTLLLILEIVGLTLKITNLNNIRLTIFCTY